MIQDGWKLAQDNFFARNIKKFLELLMLIVHAYTNLFYYNLHLKLNIKSFQFWSKVKNILYLFYLSNISISKMINNSFHYQDLSPKLYLKVEIKYSKGYVLFDSVTPKICKWVNIRFRYNLNLALVKAKYPSTPNNFYFLVSSKIFNP